MRLRLFLVAAAVLAATAAFPIAASAQPRMLIGFQDDPSLRWRDDRLNVFDLGEQAHAGIVRTTVYWSRIAQTRPANGANPFDPAYRFDDLDEFVRNAGLHGMEVMLTIWGTPAWANGGKGQNYAPTSYADAPELRAGAGLALLGPLPGLSRSSATTRSGTSRTSASSSRRSTTRRASRSAPAIYAKLYRAAYAGIKAGNSRVARRRSARPRRAGATATSGKKGTQETESPGKFAELLSQQRPALQLRRLVAPPVPDVDQRQAAREDALAERDAVATCRSSRTSSTTGSTATSRSGSPSTATRRSRRSRRASPTRSRPPTCKHGADASPPTTRTCRCSSGSSCATTRRAPGRADWSSATATKKPAFSAFAAPGDAVRRRATRRSS